MTTRQEQVPSRHCIWIWLHNESVLLQGHPCAERRMRPRAATLKVDEEYFSSDSEEPLTLNMPAAEGMPLITSGARPSPPLAALQALLNLLSQVIADRIASRLKHQALAAWVLERGA